MKPTRRSPAWIAAAVAAVLLIVPPAFASWESSYKDGKAAYDAGEYGKAIKLLRDAIADKPDEKANAIKSSGMFFESYVPHFYLGMALFQKKDFKGALDELNASESMKVVQKLKDVYAQLRQTKALAEAAGASEAPQVAQQQSPPASPPSTKEPPVETPPVKETVKEIPKAVPIGPDPALTQAIAAAAGDIAGAQKFAVDNAKYLDDGEKRRLDALAGEIRGSSSPAAATAKRQELQKAVADLRAKTGDLKKAEETRLAQQRKDEEEMNRRAAQNKALADAVAKAAPALQEAERFLSENRANLPEAEGRRIQGLLDGTRRGATPEIVTKGAADLRGAVASSRKGLDERRASGARDAQGQFASGVTAYFEGRYDDALPALQRASAGLPKDASVQGFLGCAYYKKFLLTKGTDSGLKQQAEQAFKAAYASDRSYSLDPKYYPPKLIAFYREVTARR